MQKTTARGWKMDYASASIQLTFYQCYPSCVALVLGGFLLLTLHRLDHSLYDHHLSLPCWTEACPQTVISQETHMAMYVYYTAWRRSDINETRGESLNVPVPQSVYKCWKIKRLTQTNLYIVMESQGEKHDIIVAHDTSINKYISKGSILNQ